MIPVFPRSEITWTRFCPQISLNRLSEVIQSKFRDKYWRSMTFILYCLKRKDSWKYSLLWAYIFSLKKKVHLENYSSICDVCNRRLISLFNLLNQLTYFHSIRYKHCATGGHSSPYVIISNNEMTGVRNYNAAPTLPYLFHPFEIIYGNRHGFKLIILYIV